MIWLIIYLRSSKNSVYRNVRSLSWAVLKIQKNIFKTPNNIFGLLTPYVKRLNWELLHWDITLWKKVKN